MRQNALMGSGIKFNWASIPKICINLAKREDRRKGMEFEFNRVGIHDFIFSDAVDKRLLRVPSNSLKLKEKNSAGILACATSHIDVIEAAKLEDCSYVCVFEDDIIFCDDFQERIEYVERLDLDFDLFYLGGHFANESDATLVLPYIYQLKNNPGSYGYIMRSTIYDYVLKNWNYNWGWDEFLDNHIQKNFRALAFLPFMVGHLPGFSDVVGIKIEYKCVNDRFKKERLW